MPPIRAVPAPDLAAARHAAQAWWRQGHVFGAMEALHDALGDVFRIPLPGFESVVLVGPEANRFILHDAQEGLRWRVEHDPVTRLLRRGILVTDGAVHDALRESMTPALHKSLFDGFVQAMWQQTDPVAGQWHEGSRIDLLVEMRRITLLILTQTLFTDDFGPHIGALWRDIERTLRYISPGPWLVWPTIPRPGYGRALRHMDAYFYELIARRRALPGTTTDLLGGLIAAGANDSLIRDQLLTMFIAGHDTSTALLAWCLYLLSTHQHVLARVQAEIDAVIGTQTPTYAHARQLRYLDCVIKETLRLYPPIHLGSRIAARSLVFHDLHIPAETRLLYSIYLTHRDRRYWQAPEQFDPDRFLPERAQRHAAYTYLPFGGGPRNCIGAAFAQIEAKIVLARILQRHAFSFVGGKVRPRMRATLEPHPGVAVTVQRRALANARAI